MEYLCHELPQISSIVVNTSQSFLHPWPITRFVTILTRRVPLVEQELLTLPEHLSSPPIFSGFCVTWSLVLCVYFEDHCLSFFHFSFGHCVICPSSIYGFWLYLWYLQTLLKHHSHNPAINLVWTGLYVLYYVRWISPFKSNLHYLYPRQYINVTRICATRR